MITKRTQEPKANVKFYDFLGFLYRRPAEIKLMKENNYDEYEDLLEQFYDIYDNYKYYHEDWIYKKIRIRPVRINHRMRYFLEVLVERKISGLGYDEYLKMKRKYSNFDYKEYAAVTSWVGIKKPKKNSYGYFIEHRRFRGSGNYTYEELVEIEPRTMCKTMKEAKKLQEDFLKDNEYITLTN